MKRALGKLQRLQLALVLFGIAALGYYGYTLSDQYIYQAYQNWAFDQEIAGRTYVTFGDYLRERTPLGALLGRSPVPAATAPQTESKPEVNQPPRPAEGAVLGRVSIARLHVAAIIREGVDAKVLSVAVGHVPSTALPGQPGNFAIAAHRDTLFRALKDIDRGDLVSVETPNATYSYKVVATKIVQPTDVSVLQSDGGGLIPHVRLVSSDGQPHRLLTMITCYPFYYVGSAPKRFIVEAELVSGTGMNHPELEQISDTTPPPPSSSTPTLASRAKHRKPVLQAQLARPHSARGVSHTANLHPASARQGREPEGQKKKSFWRRIFRVA